MLNQISSPASPDVHIIEQEVQTYQKTLVGAYCRVSTDMEVQKSSLETQMMAYKRIIADHPGWVLAGIYADEGLSGTSVNRRTEFQRMISDAKAGKLNYILVKSISRFSRNTVDLLQYVRELKQIGVNVYFEKEHIDTGAGSSEFLLSIFGAAAQEEIISLSNNMKVARRMRFAQGKEQWTHIYGYERGWEIVPEEAEVIQRIYRMYVNGNSLTEICDELNNEGIPVSTGKGRWEAHSIAMMMKNEKYAGHILMQKSFIKDPITHEKVSNRDAIIPQYFKRNHHAPIVSEEIWEAANLIMTMKDIRRGVVQYPFYGILHCPFCGANMVRFHHSGKDWYWTCCGKKDGTTRSERSSCPPFAVSDTALLHSLEEAGLPTEYWPLKQIAASITFPKGDWDHLLIKPATAGEEPILIPIEYDRPSNSPLPIIKEKLYEWRYIRGNEVFLTVFINGIPMERSRSGIMVKHIRNLQNRVRSLRILPHEHYESDVPKVEKTKGAKVP